jgi:poly(ADP-ribose) glycohydrolase
MLALMFFCALPKQEKYLDLPGDYTLLRLYSGNQDREDQAMEKLKCFLNYFERAEDAEDNIYLSFIRRELKEKIDWASLDIPFTEITIDERLLPAEDFPNNLIVDFAACHIGGGVLGKGCVQEEIMFLRYIEPISAMLFTEKLEDRECLVVVGVQRYNILQGYRQTFQYIGSYYEAVNLDSQRRNDTHIVAIDAINFDGKSHIQYFPGFIRRELEKALIGFQGDPSENSFREIVTGRWGCGAFKGDDQLKFIIQAISAAVSGRSMLFLPWDMKQIPMLHTISHILKTLRVKDVITELNKYKKNERDDVFSYLFKIFS